MAVHVVKVPDIGEGVAEVELVAWHLKPGDTVVEDQPLCDVMTDKATVEIPSPVAGTVTALGGEVGNVLAVGSELVRIELAQPPHDRATARAAPAAGASASPRAAALPRETAAQSARTGTGAQAAGDAIAPLAATAKPTLDRATPLRPPAVAAVPQPLPREPMPSGRGAPRPIASPAVRRRGWEFGIDLADVTPTGTAGRIVQADLDAYAATHGDRAAGGARDGAPAVAARDKPPRAAAAEHTEAVTGLRRRIAQKMQDAKRRIPHFSYVEEIDVTELEALRASLNAQQQEGGAGRPRLTLLPFLLRAIVRAVRDFPEVNARFDDEAGRITRFDAVHAGIATQTDAGLMVPVLRDAGSLDLWQAALEIARLADKARAGRATRDELSGSTITLTSLGALGGIASTPIINAPEVAIVGVNRIVERPVLRDGLLAARSMMNLSSSFDHRVIDGMVAARFVQRIRGLLEQPALLFIG